MGAEKIYTSDYGAADRITAAQRLAEIACGRMAKADGKTLGDRFWLKDPWKKTFITQVRHANTLLRVASAEAVFKAVRANPWAFSLANKKLEAAVLAEQGAVDRAIRKSDADVKAEEESPPAPAPPRPIRKPGGGDGIRSRLKGL